MMALFPNDKVKAIEAFASKAFPGFDIDVSRGGGTGPRLVVSGSGKVFTLVVNRDFLDEFGPVSLQSNLNCKGAAEAMKANEGKTCVISRGGLSCS